jgi:hypothetical protein
MADTMRAAFCLGDAALSVRWDDGQRYDRNSFHLSIGSKSGAGDCQALVVPQPVPRHARAPAVR